MRAVKIRRIRQMHTPHNGVEWRTSRSTRGILDITDPRILVAVTVILVPNVLRLVHLENREVKSDFIIFDYGEIDRAGSRLRVCVGLSRDQE